MTGRPLTTGELIYARLRGQIEPFAGTEGPGSGVPSTPLTGREIVAKHRAEQQQEALRKIVRDGRIAREALREAMRS